MAIRHFKNQFTLFLFLFFFSFCSNSFGQIYEYDEEIQIKIYLEGGDSISEKTKKIGVYGSFIEIFPDRKKQRITTEGMKSFTFRNLIFIINASTRIRKTSLILAYNDDYLLVNCNFAAPNADFVIKRDTYESVASHYFPSFVTDNTVERYITFLEKYFGKESVAKFNVRKDRSTLLRPTGVNLGNKPLVIH